MSTLYRPAEWSNWDDRYRAQFFNSLYGGRLLALLGTEKDGKVNLCPVSQIVHVGASPPSLGILLRPESDRHQTRQNLSTGCPISLHWMPSDELLNAHQCSAAYPPEQSEADVVGWTYLPLPECRLKEALLSARLTWRETHDLFNGTALYVFSLDALYAHIEPDPHGFWDFGGQVLHSQGLDHYGRFESTATLPYARP